MQRIKGYIKGIGIAGLLLFWALPFAPVLLHDVRVWLLFVLGIILVGSHPPTKFGAFGLAERTVEDRYSALFLTVAVYVSFLPVYIHYVLTIRQSTSPPLWTWFQVLAAVSASFGIGLRVSAIQTLGRWFTNTVATSPDQQLIQTGPYRWVRHPSYTGALLFWGSAPFLFGIWEWALLGWPVLLAAYLWRVRAEERAMAEHFGAPFQQYRQKTKRLLPFVF